MNELEKMQVLAASEFEVHDFIKETNERADSYRDNPDLHTNGFIHNRQPVRLDPKEDVYPKRGSYTFQNYAGPVFEFGGFGDMTLVDPYTQQRLWVSQSTLLGLNGYEALRKVIYIAEAIDFLKDDSEQPDPSETPAGPAPDGLGSPTSGQWLDPEN